jgi:phage-related protein
MAGPSVMVRILGDMTGLGNSFTAAGQKGTSAAASMHSAFSGMLGTLNSTGVLGPFGTALATADTAMQNVGKHAKDVGPTMLGVGGAVAGLGLALSSMASKDEAAHQQLQAAIAATGHSYDQYGTKVEDAIKHEEHFGTTADQTQDALRVLTQATNSPTEALKLLNTATDLAAAKHEDLSSAAEQLGKAYNGSGKIMKEFGITVSSTGTAQKALETATKAATAADDKASSAKRALAELEAQDATKKSLTTVETMKLQDAQGKANVAYAAAVSANANLATAQKNVADGTSTNSKAIDELGKKLAGQASAQADTFTGHLKALRAEVEDHVAEFGQKYGPAITAAGAAMSALGAVTTVTTTVTTAMKEAAILTRIELAAMSVWEGIVTAAQWAWNLAMEANPLILIVTLIALAIAAVVAIGIKFGWWKDIALDLWQWMQVVWNGILDVISAVWHWIAGNWPLLLGILTGPIGLAVEQIVTHLGDVKAAVMDCVHFITSAFDAVKNALYGAGVAIIEGLKRGLQDAWKDVTSFLDDAAKKVGNFLKNPLSILSPSRVMIEQGRQIMEGLGIGLATGFDQHVAGALNSTVGAITGASSAGRGPAPAPALAAATSSGPAVSIQNAHFASTLDVDSFMARVSWLAQTGRV